jgi:uncharacterized protein YbaR (Trm112 family)
VNFDHSLLEILACPSEDHAPLTFDEGRSELLCTACRRAFPVRDGIPVLLLEEAVVPSEETAGAVEDGAAPR